MHIGCLGWVSAQTRPFESQDNQCDGCDLNERNTEFGTESLIYEIASTVGDVLEAFPERSFERQHSRFFKNVTSFSKR
jgi:hypothetical protein